MTKDLLAVAQVVENWTLKREAASQIPFMGEFFHHLYS